MGVCEPGNLGDTVVLLDQLLDIHGLWSCNARLCLPRLLEGEFEGFLLSQLVELAGEVLALLGSNLPSGRIVCGCAVAARPYALSAGHPHVIIDHKTSALVLHLVADLRHDGFRQWPGSISSSPDEETVWDAVGWVVEIKWVLRGCPTRAGNSLEQILLLILSDDMLLADLLNHGAGQHFNLVLLECLGGVITERGH